MKPLSRIFSTLVLVATVGCASFSKPRHVLVSVVDETGQPLAGVWVSNRLLFDDRLRAPRSSDVRTGPDGLAMLVTRDPVFYYIYTKDGAGEYREKAMLAISSLDEAKLRARAADYHPTAPDVVFTILSDKEEAKRKEAHQRELEIMEKEARRIFEQNPDFWPETRDNSEWVKDSTGLRLIELRWESASKEPLGTPADAEAIRRVVEDRMKLQNGRAGEIRWLTSSRVMVAASWYYSSVAAAGYTFVLDKHDGQWTITARYMNWIS